MLTVLYYWLFKENNQRINVFSLMKKTEVLYNKITFSVFVT